MWNLFIYHITIIYSNVQKSSSIYIYKGLEGYIMYTCSFWKIRLQVMLKRTLVITKKRTEIGNT